MAFSESRLGVELTTSSGLRPESEGLPKFPSLYFFLSNPHLRVFIPSQPFFRVIGLGKICSGVSPLTRHLP